jgi:ABC-2 type transport system permease protein
VAETVASTSLSRSGGALSRNFNVTRELAITQFKLKYTGSALGYVWSLIKPMMIFGIMYAVFGIILNVGRGATDFPLQLLIGVVLWSFFAETTGIAVSSIIVNGTLVQRAFFPRSILVIANSASAAMTFLINITLIVVIATPLGHLDLGLRSLFAVPLMIELYLIILGIALLVSSLFVFFRDLGHVWEILLQVLFYASGVVYPIASIANHPMLKDLLCLNPLTQIIEDMRHVLVTPTAPWTVQIFSGLHGSGPGDLPWAGGWEILVPIVITFGVFAVGVWVFRTLSPKFAENL